MSAWTIFFAGTGALIWGIAAAILAWSVLASLAMAVSLTTVQIVAVFRNKRQHLAKWRRLPRDFLVQWWEFWARGYSGYTVTSEYYVWRGVFDFTIYRK